MKIDISLPQVYAGLRYAGVSVGAVMSFLTVMNAISPDTAHQIVTAFQLVIDDLQKTIGDMSKLLVLVVPVVTIWLAKIGVSSASPVKQAAAVQASEKMQVATTDPEIAKAVPGVQLVATLPTAK